MHVETGKRVREIEQGDDWQQGGVRGRVGELGLGGGRIGGSSACCALSPLPVLDLPTQGNMDLRGFFNMHSSKLPH